MDTLTMRPNKKAHHPAILYYVRRALKNIDFCSLNIHLANIDFVVNFNGNAIQCSAGDCFTGTDRAALFLADHASIAIRKEIYLAICKRHRTIENFKLLYLEAIELDVLNKVITMNI